MEIVFGLCVAFLLGYGLTYVGLVRPMRVQTEHDTSAHAKELATAIVRESASDAEAQRLAAMVDSLSEQLDRAAAPAVDHSAEWADDQRNALYASRCPDCGCVHTIACPRIKRSRFADNGTTRVEVEYFATWDRAGVVAVDDFMEQNEPPTASTAVRVTG